MRSLPGRVTHVVFDLDGVLLDTEPLYTEATRRIVARFGRTFDWRVKSRMIGRPAAEAARILVEQLDLPLDPSALLAERAAVLASLLPDAAAMPGAPELVTALAARRVPMAIATSSVRPLVDLELTRHREWLRPVRVLITGDDPRLVRGKPAPDIYLLAAADLGADPALCVAVEDAPAGIEAARAAGMQVVAVPDRALVGRENLDLRASLVVDSLRDLTPAVLGVA